MKRARRHAFERLGLDRYSHPAYDDLDRKLADYLPDQGGTFVEAGAYDGYWESNTYWFERFRAWTGVLIEPVPELAEMARRERPRSKVFQCALVPPEHGDDAVTLRYDGVMSAVAGISSGDEEERADVPREHQETLMLQVPARVLSDVLHEACLGAIDLISLDVEGFEASVLRGLDLARHAPRFLLVEMLWEDKQRQTIEAALGPGYVHEAKLSHRDHLYRRTL